MSTSSDLAPEYCEYLEVDAVGPVHPLVEALVPHGGSNLVRIGTLMNGRCSLAAVLRAVNEAGDAPTEVEADLVRLDLHDMVEQWTDEQWAQRIPKVQRLYADGSRRAFVDQALSQLDTTIDATVFYLWHVYDAPRHPLVYVVGQNRNTHTPEQHHLTVTVECVPIRPYPEYVPTCAIILLRQGENDFGHFETIGLLHTGDGVQTVFELDDPVIEDLRKHGSFMKDLQAELDREEHKTVPASTPAWRSKPTHAPRYSTDQITPETFPLLHAALQRRSPARQRMCVVCCVLMRSSCHCYHKETTTERSLIHAEDVLARRRDRARLKRKRELETETVETETVETETVETAPSAQRLRRLPHFRIARDRATAVGPVAPDTKARASAGTLVDLTADNERSDLESETG